jgi:hypothetical protein
MANNDAGKQFSDDEIFLLEQQRNGKMAKSIFAKIGRCLRLGRKATLISAPLHF